MERILKWMTNEGSDKAVIYTQWFANTFSPDNFNGIEQIYACFIKYCAHLNIVPSQKFLEAYLKVDGMSDVKRYGIKLEDMGAYDYTQLSQLMEAYEVIKQVAYSTYEIYLGTDLEGRDFKVDMYDYMSNMKSEKITQAMMRALPALQDGSNVTEVSMDLRSSLSRIDETYDVDKIKNVDFTTANGKERQKLEFITYTRIPCIDTDVNGIFTHLMYTINGQPSGGKTRLGLIHFAYNVMVQAKRDVVVYATELTQAQCENIMIAYHITQLYGGSIKIPDSLMNQGRLTQEQERIVESARIDLFESGKYGQFIVRDECVVETLESELWALARMYPNLAMVMIDYMGLVKSKPVDKFSRRLETYQIITDAYIAVRNVIRVAPMCAVCLNQYNEDGIKAALAGKMIGPGHIQGGQIVHRHTDYDLSLTYTEEQRLARVRNLQNSKTRGSAGFNPALLRVDLSVSIFRQEVME